MLKLSSSIRFPIGAEILFSNNKSAISVQMVHLLWLHERSLFFYHGTILHNISQVIFWLQVKHLHGQGTEVNTFFN